MERAICKCCGGVFWETVKGARGEDLCDSCEDETQDALAPRLCSEANNPPASKPNGGAEHG